jgi:hypothetical protein
MSRGRGGGDSAGGGAGGDGSVVTADAGDAASAWAGRRSPSASALRRTRSAWASSIDDEWLFTPIPSDRQRSSASLFVSPSSRASS